MTLNIHPLFTWHQIAGVAYWRHADLLGSSRLASTINRTVYYDGAYAPFGENYAETGTTDRDFTGQHQDMTSGLYDFTLRQQSSSQGRWMVPDPAGSGAVDITDPQTWNRYAYLRNGPLNAVDPLGLHHFCLSGPYTGIPAYDCGWETDQSGGGTGDWSTCTGCDGGGDVGYGWGSGEFDTTSQYGWQTPSLSSEDTNGIITDPVTGDVISAVPTQVVESLSGGGWQFLGVTPTFSVSATSYFSMGESSQVGIGADPAEANKSKLNKAASAAMHTLVVGQAVSTAVGCGVGVLVAAGATAASDTFPLAGVTLPAGCVGGGMVGFVEALPYSTLTAIVDFGWTYWRK